MSPIFSQILKQNISKLNKIVDYVEIVLLLLYQFVPDNSLIALMEEEKANDLNTRIVKYINKQENNAEGILNLGQYIDTSKDFFCCKLNAVVVEQKTLPLEDFQISNEKQLLILLTQIIFYSTKMIKHDRLKDDKNVALYTELITKLQYSKF